MSGLVHFADGGKLTDTGKIGVINSGTFPILVCAKCGLEFDESDYELIGRPDSPWYRPRPAGRMAS